MSRIAYVNGRYIRQNLAEIPLMDRAAQFGDGVYEVILLQEGHFFDAEPHLQRLWQSMERLEMQPPCSMPVMRLIMRELLRRNRVRDGGIYIQVSRGVCMRKHEYPEALPSFLTAFMVPPKKQDPERWKKGYHALVVEDERWAQCDIKSTSLIPNVTARQQAMRAGAAEALFVSDDGVMREGALSNLFMVAQDGVLHTHPLSRHILPGITRAAILGLARDMEMTIKETPFSYDDMLGAKELFVTSTVAKMLAFTQVGGHVIHGGQVGPVATELMAAYERMIKADIASFC